MLRGLVTRHWRINAIRSNLARTKYCHENTSIAIAAIKPWIKFHSGDTQSSSPFAPSPGVIRPLGHKLQDTAPSIEVKLPCGHVWKLDPPTWLTYAPGGASKHELKPSVSEYFPSWHNKHPPGPVAPYSLLNRPMLHGLQQSIPYTQGSKYFPGGQYAVG